jgi:peptide chain release factor subunit 1
VQVQKVTRETLRRLARLSLDDGKVLSVYLNLDPREFATGAARSSAIRSVLDEAGRRAREHNGGLSHDARKALHEDVERVSSFLDRADLKGAHALALFAAGPAGLFETVKLPRPVDNEVVVANSPFVEPLTEMVAAEGWCVMLANRRDARIFVGSAEGLAEVERVTDDVHGQHDQGGWSQARYQRSVDNEAAHHLRRSAEALLQRFRRAPFQHLLLGTPKEAYSALEAELHPYLRERLRGRLELAVENSTAEHVSEAARPLIERFEQERQAELLARLREGLGSGGRAVAGLADVLRALNEQRVEALLMEAGFSAPGAECLRCGWVGADRDESSCPADDSPLERRDDVTELAVERALMQDAEVVVLRDQPDLGPHGRIAALTRF